MSLWSRNLINLDSYVYMYRGGFSMATIKQYEMVGGVINL